MRAVAERCGVSRTTVSLVLNGKDSEIAEATRERVLAAARELGYLRPASAEHIRTGRWGTVGLIGGGPGNRDAVPHPLLWYLEEAVFARGSTLTLSPFQGNDLKHEQQLSPLLDQWRCDGILAHWTGGSEADMGSRMQDHALPVIWLNDDRPTDAVLPDDLRAARDLTQRLIALGHRHITYLGHGDAAPQHYSRRERWQGYHDTMLEAGLEPEALPASRFGGEWPLGPQRARQLLERPDRPSAVITYGLHETINLFLAALDLGWSLPRDLSLASFGFGPTPVPISKLRLPYKRMASEAVQMLFSRIDGDAVGAEPAVRCPFQEDTGSTIGPAPA